MKSPIINQINNRNEQRLRFQPQPLLVHSFCFLNSRAVLEQILPWTGRQSELATWVLLLRGREERRLLRVRSIARPWQKRIWRDSDSKTCRRSQICLWEWTSPSELNCLFTSTPPRGRKTLFLKSVYSKSKSLNLKEAVTTNSCLCRSKEVTA